MKDILVIIYEEMIKNEVIKRECADRIKFYLYPETGITNEPFITLRPLAPPEPTTHGSNENLSYKHFIQIDVQSHDRKRCKIIQGEVKKVMNELGFSQKSGGIDTYFEETKRFVDARRYLGNTKIYDKDY